MLSDLRKEGHMISIHQPDSHCLEEGVTVNSMMTDMFAKKNDCCKEKVVAMHIGIISVGAMPAIAIVGGEMPVADSIEISCQLRKTNNVVVCFLGDGATNEGAFQ